MDATINGCRYREPLGTTDWREARRLEGERITQLKERAPDPAKRSKSYGAMTVAVAVEAYVAERRAQVSPRMVGYWREQARPLAAFFKTIKLKSITPAHLSEYQNARIDSGKAAKTVNGELSVLRQLLKHARLWYRFLQDYKPIPNSRPPVGRALGQDEQARLFETAKTRPAWLYAYTAATLGAFCGLRACEIRGLQWKDVDLTANLLDIRRSKTPGGWREPSLNTACADALAALREKAQLINATEPDHYVFPWHGRAQEIDPTRPITSWRSAWRSILREAGIKARFHDLRHSACTTMLEKGLPDHVVMAQLGHVSPQMLKTYGHIRRQALNQAAAALEPNFPKPTRENELLI
jgi:integrase